MNWMIGATISALPLVRAGRLRAIAVTSAQRSKALPDLPTVAESGIPGYEVIGWFAMFAPTGIPMAIVETLSAETRRGLMRPEFASIAEAQGMDIVGSTPAELGRLVRTEMAMWQKVVKTMGIKP